MQHHHSAIGEKRSRGCRADPTVPMAMLGKALRAAGGLAATGAALTYAAYRYERSKVPAGSELICSTTAPASPPVVLKRLSADNLMGGFDAYYLGGTWFYDQPLDAAKIKAALTEGSVELKMLRQILNETPVGKAMEHRCGYGVRCRAATQQSAGSA